MKIKKNIRNKNILLENQQSRKTLAYVGEKLKMQKKIAYEHSPEYILQRREMYRKMSEEREEKIRRKRWEEMDQQEALNKKSPIKQIFEYGVEIIEFFIDLITEPFIQTYRDLKKELKLK